MLSYDRWRRKCLLVAGRGMWNVQILAYSSGSVRKSWIKGNDKWSSGCLVVLRSRFFHNKKHPLAFISAITLAASTASSYKKTKLNILSLQLKKNDV